MQSYYRMNSASLSLNRDVKTQPGLSSLVNTLFGDVAVLGSGGTIMSWLLESGYDCSYYPSVVLTPRMTEFIILKKAKHRIQEEATRYAHATGCTLHHSTSLPPNNRLWNYNRRVGIASCHFVLYFFLNHTPRPPMNAVKKDTTDR